MTYIPTVFLRCNRPLLMTQRNWRDGNRYRKLNFLPYLNFKTVEFRQHAGTVQRLNAKRLLGIESSSDELLTLLFLAEPKNLRIRLPRDAITRRRHLHDAQRAKFSRPLYRGDLLSQCAERLG